MRDRSKAMHSTARISCYWIFVLGLSVLLGSCKESPRFVKAGQPFAEEKVPSFKAVVYIYWPAEERGRRSQLWVESCKGMDSEIFPGGYMSLVVNPGPSCFRAQMQWDLSAVDAVTVETLSEVELSLRPGRSSFLRLERGTGLLPSRFVLRPIAPDAAKPEIAKCRQAIPLSSEERVRAMEGAPRS